MESPIPTKCISCNAKIGNDPKNTCYAVYKCRADHYCVVCKVDCQRILEKRTDKVADGLRKIMHKLNNDGHTSALRRLPPAEREKLKQLSEADSNGWMICPEEVKACDRSVPQCAHVMIRDGGYGGKEDAEIDQDPDSPSKRAQPPPPPMQSGEGQADLLDDDMLIEIKKDNDDKGDEPGSLSSKNKKKSKQGAKSKKGQVLLLDFKSPAVETAESAEVISTWSKPAVATKTAVSPATRSAPMGLGAAQAWSAVAASRTPDPVIIGTSQASPSQKPTDWMQKVKTLTSTTSCSDQRALELLQLRNWDLESAADLFFNQDPGDRPRWGPRAGVQSSPLQSSSQPPQQQQQQQSSPQTQQQAQPQEEAAQSPGQIGASHSQPPAPTQPPPPRLPPQWQALWSEEQQAYYFWHVPTNQTTWYVPAVEEGSLEAGWAESEAQQAEEDERRRREELVIEACEMTGVSRAQAQELLESQGWNLEQAVQVQVRKEEEEKKRIVREENARRQAEERAQERARVAEAIKAAETKAAEARAAEAKAAEAKVAEEERRRQEESVARCTVREGHFVCTRHWRPRPGLDVCIRLFHGERVQVTWVDGKDMGWAYGNMLGEPDKEGYFPQEILAEVRRAPSYRSAGELCGVGESFQAPEEVGGYLSVEKGDILKVLYPIDSPYVWAYVERHRSCRQGAQHIETVGWVPEAVLNHYAEADGFVERGHQPVG